MSPAPAKTTDAAIAEAARRIIDESGVEALSMQTVADAVGVRAPSLYKRFPHKNALLDQVALNGMAELTDVLEAAARGRRGAEALAAMGRAYRRFSRASPGLYSLLFTTRPEGPELLAGRAKAVGPVLTALAALVPADDRLHAARLLTAFLHGFVTMENAGLFKLGGSVSQAFDFGLSRLLLGLGQARQ